MIEIIIDTNILSRYFLDDIEDQSKKAQEIIRAIEKKKQIGLISILVLDELIWALETYYHLQRSAFLPTLIELLSFPQIKIIETKKEVVLTVLEKMQKYPKIDLTDIYLFTIANGRKIASFEKDFQKLKP